MCCANLPQNEKCEHTLPKEFLKRKKKEKKASIMWVMLNILGRIFWPLLFYILLALDPHPVVVDWT